MRSLASWTAGKWCQLWQPPPLVMFTVAEIPGKGMGLIATRKITKGELVIKERPVVRGRDVFLEGPWQSLKDFIAAEVQDDDKVNLLALHDPDPEGPSESKMERIYLNNTYGHGLFIESSRMNHSCLPCVEMSMDEGKETEVRSVRDIEQGEEITVSYLKTSLLLLKKERVERLEYWGFLCKCVLCQLDDEESRRNDSERKRVRETLSLLQHFFQRLSQDSVWDPSNVQMVLRRLYILGRHCLDILDTRLRGEAEPVVVQLYLFLAALVELAATPTYSIQLPEDPTTGTLMSKARAKAEGLGNVFLQNCNTREKELDQIRRDFGKSLQRD